jgi:hypothetical protein
VRARNHPAQRQPAGGRERRRRGGEGEVDGAEPEERSELEPVDRGARLEDVAR